MSVSSAKSPGISALPWINRDDTPPRKSLKSLENPDVGHAMLCFETQKFELQTRNFLFPYSKFSVFKRNRRVSKFEAGKLITKRYVPYVPPYLPAINMCLDKMEEFKGRDIAVS